MNQLKPAYKLSSLVTTMHNALAPVEAERGPKPQAQACLITRFRRPREFNPNAVAGAKKTSRGADVSRDVVDGLVL